MRTGALGCGDGLDADHRHCLGEEAGAGQDQCAGGEGGIGGGPVQGDAERPDQALAGGQRPAGLVRRDQRQQLAQRQLLAGFPAVEGVLVAAASSRASSSSL